MAFWLIIDPNSERANAIKLMLRFAMHEAEHLKSGDAAISYLQTHPAPQGIVANLILDGLDGFQLARALKSNPDWAQIPLVLLGEADHDPRDENLAKRAGAAAFLRRPIQRDQFLSEVDQALLLAHVQENPLAKNNPQEELSFLRDYNAWLSTMLYRRTHLLDQTADDLIIRDAHVYAMNTLTTALSADSDFYHTAKTLVTKAAEILRAQAGAIYYYDEKADTFRLAYTAGFGMPKPTVPSDYELDETSPIWRVTGRDKALLFSQPEGLRALHETFKLSILPASAIVAPLISQGEFSGFLLILRADELFVEEEADTLFSLGGAAGLALQSAELFSRLQKAFANLQELDRRKSEFVAITSHELRTPIAIMLGYASLLLDMEDDPHKKAQLVTIEKQANFLTGMVDALLNLHELNEKDEPLKLRCSPIRLDELLRQALKVTQEHSTQRKEVLCHIDCDPIKIEGDEIRLMLAFNNLLDNAIKFSENGGKVDVLVAERLEGGVIITVQDEGIGIEEQHFEKIFEPFFQVEPAMTRHHGGLGLGLAIVKGMIELHEGRIEVKSRFGEGSRFIITLPAELPPHRCQESSY